MEATCGKCIHGFDLYRCYIQLQWPRHVLCHHELLCIVAIYNLYKECNNLLLDWRLLYTAATCNTYGECTLGGLPLLYAAGMHNSSSLSTCGCPSLLCTAAIYNSCWPGASPINVEALPLAVYSLYIQLMWRGPPPQTHLLYTAAIYNAHRLSTFPSIMEATPCSRQHNAHSECTFGGLSLLYTAAM